MPVDKFGRTDAASAGSTQVVERVVSGGVSLSQINDVFLKRDGENAATGDINLDSHKLINVGEPINDSDAATKNYVDDVGARKVSKTGDTITGNLLLSIGSDHLRMLGCHDLGDTGGFLLYLGNEDNQIKSRKNHPILMQTNNGFICRLGDIDIIRFGRSSADTRTEVFDDLLMNQHFIANLRDPHSAQDAATKNYVDSASKKNLVGYIPPLESNNSRTGFVITASTNRGGYLPYEAFNNTKNSWLTSADNPTGWILIKCPEAVRIWRVALKARLFPNRNITAWYLSASNNGTTFTSLIGSQSAPSTTVLEGAAASPSFFEVTTNNLYQYYRFVITASNGSNDVGVQYMQLYVYDV